MWGPVAQLARAPAWHAGGQGFEPPSVHTASTTINQARRDLVKSCDFSISLPLPLLFVEMLQLLTIIVYIPTLQINSKM